MVISGLMLLTCFCLYGQASDKKSYSALSARVFAIDHNYLNETIDGASQTYALELSYRRQFNNYLGLAIPLKLGLIDVGELDNMTVAGIEAQLHLFPFGSEGKIAPYLLGGYGVVTERFDDANHQTPLGLGINFKLDRNSWFNVQGEYRLSDQAERDNVMAGIGYVYRISSLDSDDDGILNKNDKCPSDAGPAATGGCPDTDMDGVVDGEDACPAVAGPASTKGCPDQDGDMVPDGEDICPDEAGPAKYGGCPDTDGDGVIDLKDECPDKYSIANTFGCPDTDGDGLYDHEDMCPDTSGTIMGCPDDDGDGIPNMDDRCPQQAGAAPSGCPSDADMDGFADEIDECPNLAGKYKGCPDTDMDGVIDQDDKCPNTPGPDFLGGCPEVAEKVYEQLRYAARAVQFESGSARLKEESFYVLSEVANILREYPDYNLTISGHTDNTGSDLRNLDLSRDRARTCHRFIVASGITDMRISSAGYGATRPLASNTSSDGRKMNRRVEFELIPVRRR